MSDVLYLENNIEAYDDIAAIRIHKNAYEVIRKIPYKDRLLRELTYPGSLVMVRAEEDRTLFTIYVDGYCLSCRTMYVDLDDPSAGCRNELLAVGCSQASVSWKGYIMKSGSRVSFSQGLLVHFTSGINEPEIDPPGKHWHYYDVGTDSSLVKYLDRMVVNGRKYSDDEETDERFELEDDLGDLLDLAASYVSLSDDLEDKNAREAGDLFYREFRGVDAAEHKRFNRPSYAFFTRNTDIDSFSTGTSVAVSLSEDEKYSGSITDVTLKEDHAEIVIMFNEHIDVEKLPKQGSMYIEPMHVASRVQNEAINKIRTGKVNYLNTVLGRHSSSGFDHKNLTKLDKAMDAENYPPNPSQKEGIKKGINTKDILMVMGPPGTGKTTVIEKWIDYFVNTEHKRVLVSSQNNSAVDNVLTKFKDMKSIQMLRLGQELKISSDVQPFMFVNRITELEERIAGQSAERIRKAEKEIVDIGNEMEYVERLCELDKNIAAFKWTPFDNVIRNELIPLYRELRAKIAEKDEIEEKIAAVDQDIKAHPASGFLAKMKMRSVFRTRKELLKQGRDVCTKYKEGLDEYNRMFGIVLTNGFTPMYGMQAERYECAQKCAKAGIDVPAPEASEAVLAGLREKLSDRTYLIAALKDWQNEMNSANEALGEIILESVDVVGATCIGVNSQKKFANIKFDVSIIDEAGQIQIHNVLVPMSVSPKCIMLGDHKQIPPMADEKLVEQCKKNSVDTELLSKSLFEKMYNEIPEANRVFLDTQYRMPGEMADILSAAFYDGKYKSFKGKRGLDSLAPWLTKKTLLLVDTSKEPDRRETQLKEGGFYNTLEAKTISEIINALLLHGDVSPKEIGVIPPYKAQVRTIAGLVGKNESLDETTVNEMVRTLDSFQGQERDLIFYSFTRSDSSRRKDQGRIGFMKELRRLNVAISRCKHMMILVGDYEYLCNCEKDVGEASEKKFSEFIKMMLAAVDKGSAEKISIREAGRRIRGEA